MTEKVTIKDLTCKTCTRKKIQDQEGDILISWYCIPPKSRDTSGKGAETMTGHQIQCDESCPCRTSSCEETCPEYQFQERFSRWLAVQYSDLPLGAHQNIVLNASAIFDDINASNCGDESSHVPDSTELIAMANQEWKNREERRGIHNREDWCCGWMDGFLSENKPNWRQEQIDAAGRRGYERALDDLGVLHGEDARKFNEELENPSPMTPEAAEVMRKARELAARK